MPKIHQKHAKNTPKTRQKYIENAHTLKLEYTKDLQKYTKNLQKYTKNIQKNLQYMLKMHQRSEWKVAYKKWSKNHWKKAFCYKSLGTFPFSYCTLFAPAKRELTDGEIVYFFSPLVHQNGYIALNFLGVPPRLFSVGVDTDPSAIRSTGFPMAESLGIKRQKIRQLPVSKIRYFLSENCF